MNPEAAFLGLMGSLHCLGMCSGFALAFSRRGWKGTMAYQAGRACGYATVGAICGWCGEGLGRTLGSPTWQALCGLFFLAMAAGWSPRLPATGFLHFFAPLLRRPGLGAAALMGALTGLLPCGLLAAAYLKAAQTSTLTGGIGAMLSFWAGNLGPLLFVSWIPGRLPQGPLRWLPSATLVSLGLWTLVRAFLLPIVVPGGGGHCAGM